MVFLYVLFLDLTIERFCMTGGKSPIGYLKAYMTNLYLSKDSEKVQEAIEEGKLNFLLCQKAYQAKPFKLTWLVLVITITLRDILDI